MSGAGIVKGRIEDIGTFLAGDHSPIAKGPERPNIALISDENVAALYLDSIMTSLEKNGFKAFPLIVPAGEAAKTGKTYLDLLEKMAGIPLTRTDIAMVLGGGVPGDMGGFAAATYMRGIPVIQVPTTLLAMVDSAIGGKTGIDLTAGKNLAGAFHEPLFVYTDTELLRTLPRREFISGMAEVVKYGVICGEPLMSLIEDVANRISGEKAERPAEAEGLTEVIGLCQRAKLDIVSGDLRDKGKRQILNLGHTLGHAIEKASDYTVSHGEAVAAGMKAMMKIFAERGETSPECLARTERLLKKLGLPPEPGFAGSELFDIIKNDKKRKGSDIDLVVPRTIGDCVLKRLSMDELREILG